METAFDLVVADLERHFLTSFCEDKRALYSSSSTPQEEIKSFLRQHLKK